MEDNGIGFDVTAALEKRESFGISGMRERVALLGGQFRGGKVGPKGLHGGVRRFPSNCR